MKFRQWNVTIDKGSKYANGRMAIKLVDAGNFELIAVGSVNVEENLKANEIAIKDYGENEGMLNFLMENNVVSEPLRFIQQGYVIIPICNIL